MLGESFVVPVIRSGCSNSWGWAAVCGCRACWWGRGGVVEAGIGGTGVEVDKLIVVVKREEGEGGVKGGASGWRWALRRAVILRDSQQAFLWEMYTTVSRDNNCDGLGDGGLEGPGGGGSIVSSNWGRESVWSSNGKAASGGSGGRWCAGCFCACISGGFATGRI